jgi:hypothetical protein
MLAILSFFGRPIPDVVKTIEEIAAETLAKKRAKKARKTSIQGLKLVGIGALFFTIHRYLATAIWVPLGEPTYRLRGVKTSGRRGSHCDDYGGRGGGCSKVRVARRSRQEAKTRKTVIDRKWLKKAMRVPALSRALAHRSSVSSATVW